MEKILIVEDDRTLNETLRYNLQQQGYAVTAAFSVKEAEDCWRKENFQLALLDVNLPDGESFALCRRWKEDRPETAALSSIAKGDDRLTLETLSQKLKDDEWQWKAYFSMILGLSCLLILFGVINLVNTIVTGILSRKQEFAMLESIGMERRQIISMIQGEGLILAFYNGLFSLTLGGFAGWAIVAYLRDHSASYMQYQYPVWYALAYVALSAALPALISALTAKVFSRQSIVERLQKRE